MFCGGLFSWVGRVFVGGVCARKLLKGVSASQVNPWVTTPLPSPVAKAAPVVLPDPAPVWSPGGIDLEQMPLEVKSGLVKGSGMVLVGAHGGAGTSTWAQLMETEELDCFPGEPVPVVIVARWNASGIKAAHAAALQWASGLAGACVLRGVLWVPDSGGKRPRGVNEIFLSACGAFPANICAPWVEVWRCEPLAPDRGAQRLARKALALFSL